MTLPYAILELFLHNLKKNIINLEKTAACSVARRGQGSFLSFPLFFPHFPPSCLWLSHSSVHLFPTEPHKLLSHQHIVPQYFLFLLVGGMSMLGRLENHAPSSLLSCLSAWSTAEPFLPQSEPVRVFLKANAYRAEPALTTLSSF